MDSQQKNDRMGRGNGSRKGKEGKYTFPLRYVEKKSFSLSVDYLFLVIIGLKAKALKASTGRNLGSLLITSSDGTVWFSKPVFSKTMEQKHFQKHQLQIITTWMEAYRCVFL